VSSEFSAAFSLFKGKLQEFTAASSFEKKTQEYKAMLETIRSSLSQQRETYLQKSPDLVAATERALFIMEKIVSLHEELDLIFKMDEKGLAAFCDQDLTNVERVISKGLQEVAELLFEFEKVSQQRKRIIEVLEDPFLSQGS
jgi:hypothetical protein